jgi:flagellar L-ring protein precursor FlgH
MKKIAAILALAVLFLSDTNAQSELLWNKNKKQKKDSLISDMKRAKFKVHDLVTIDVNEESLQSIKATLNQDWKMEMESTINSFIRLLTKDGNFRIKEGKDTRDGITPTIDIDSKIRDLNKASTDRQSKVRFTITAQIAQIQPNGLLLLEARKNIDVRKEKETLILSGYVKEEDIDAKTNTVKSERIANLSLRAEGKGPISDNDKGFIWKLISRFWPF